MLLEDRVIAIIRPTAWSDSLFAHAVALSCLSYYQAWTGHCAVAQAPPSTNTGAPWLLQNFFDVCVTEKNYGYVIL